LTRISQRKIQCPTCNKPTKIVYYASINTFLGGAGLIEDLIQGKLYNFKCKNCGQLIKFNTNVLISTRSSMVTISTGDDLDKIKAALRSHGVLDENGKVIVDFPFRFLKGPNKWVKKEGKYPKDPPPTKIRAELEEMFKAEDEKRKKKKEI